MVSLFLLLGCNLSYIVDLFAHITKARIIGARALKTLLSHLIYDISSTAELNAAIFKLHSALV